MREKLLMNRGWRYFFGQPEFKRPKFESSDQQYRGSRAENARGPARRDFDDSKWEVVTLPHDFVAVNGLSETDPFGGEHFDFPQDRGEAWYRRYFKLDEADKDKQIILHFEAVATVSEVYVNSMLLKVNRTAGIGFDVDITDVARYGYEYNVVSVHADCHDFEAWYYEGGGITRNVWLVKTDKLAVDLWGTFVKAKALNDDYSKWELDIETELKNNYNEDKKAVVVSKIVDKNGKQVAELKSDIAVELRAKNKINQTVVLDNPFLWDTKNTNMYKLFTEVVLDGEVVDNYETNFGIRELKYTADKGLFINGKNTTIYGFANHMCYLGVGDAMSDSQREFHMRTIHDMGGNGFRTAHSPHGNATYDYCDKFGMLVMDENRVFHSSDICIDEVERMVKRDRNHPSVCMWSLYNEEDTVTRENVGKRIWKTLAEAARKLDPTRPMTGATSYGMFSEGAEATYDIFGFNHQTMNFDALHKAHPNQPIYCSEMVIPVGPQPVWMGMDVRSGEDAHQSEKDYVIGGFHFTAWDYGPDRARILDGIGGKGYGYYGFKAYLRQDEPLAKVCPEWSFPGKEGEEVDLFLANNGEYVEVYVNDEFVAKVTTDLYGVTQFKTVYKPGKIKIVAYKNGKVWAEDTSVTPGAPVAIKLELENPTLKADDDDQAIVSAYLVDKDGNVCVSETGIEATFSSNEAGEFVCAATVREDGYQGYNGPVIKFFDGKAQAFFRSMNVPGDLVVRVAAKGFETAELVIKRTEPSDIVNVPEIESNYIMDWTISKLYPNAMDDAKVMKEKQIERWEHIDTQGTSAILYMANQLYPAGTSFHYALHAYATVPELGCKNGQKLGLYFEGLDGPANVYITDGDKTAFKNHASNSPWFGHYRPEMIMTCDEFKPGDKVEVWVMMHDVGRVHGIGWPVRWVYTTDEAAEALDAQTAKEWLSSTFNDD